MKRVVDVWLANVAFGHSGSPSTARVYRRVMRSFEHFCGKSAKDILEEYEKAEEKQFKRTWGNTLRSYIAYLSDQQFAPNSITLNLAVVRSFFKYHSLPLAYVPSGRCRVLYHNREIERQEIAQIMNISKPRDRAFYAVMAQSGLRPITLCNLKVKHLEPLDKIPCKITVPQEIAKGKYGSYFTFIGAEAAEQLKRYFATRGRTQREDPIFTDYAARKPLNSKSIAGIFSRAIEQLKAKGMLDFEQKAPGKPRSLRLYVLRRWFRRAAGNAGQDYARFWMGHTLGVDSHYFSRDAEHHRKIYMEKAACHLWIEQPPQSELEDLRAEVEFWKRPDVKRFIIELMRQKVKNQ